MMRIFLIAVLISFTYADCPAPTFGSIDEDGRFVQYSCDEGFTLVGPRRTVCQKRAKSMDVKTACFPIYHGEGNCSAINACPEDLSYLQKFIFTEDLTEIEDGRLRDIEASSFADLLGRGRTMSLMCQKACRYGYQCCTRFKQQKKRKLMRKCMNCFTSNKCGAQFWG